MEITKSSNTSPLLTPYTLGKFNLSHRIVLPPLTRNRSYNNIPQVHAVEYYSQRTTNAGLLISEAAAASDISHWHLNMPGIWTNEQVDAWKPIVDGVHDKGGIFFCQIWHASPGRVNKPIILLDRFEYNDIPELRPCQLSLGEIHQTVEDFRLVACNAIEAGFDGVEILGANGFLIDQFMNDQRNDRTDQYGGCLENRCRLAMEIVETMANEIGSDRVGTKLTPFEKINGNQDSNPEALGLYLASSLNKFGLSYIHVVDPRMVRVGDKYETPRVLSPLMKAFKGTFIASGGFNKEEGDKAVDEDYADLIAFRRLFVANPDLPKRFAVSSGLNMHDRSTLYTQDPVIGYTDYSSLEIHAELSRFRVFVRLFCGCVVVNTVSTS